MKTKAVEDASKTTYIRQFDSINEMVDYTKKANTNIIFAQTMASQGTSIRHKEFTGTSNFEEAQGLLKNGWDTGAKELNKSLKVANSKMSDKLVQRTIYDVVGFQASVPRYLQGIPTNMINKRFDRKKERVITLNKSINYHSGIHKDMIIKDSVKFLQIVQAIEKRGIRVNINVSFHAIVKRESMLIKLKIKDSKERINISKLSYPLIHPSFLRRHVLRAVECEDRLKLHDWARGYGTPVQEGTQKYLDKNEFYIPVLISDDKAYEIIEGVE